MNHASDIFGMIPIADIIDSAWKTTVAVTGIVALLNAKRVWRYMWSHHKLVAETISLETQLTETHARLRDANTVIEAVSDTNHGWQALIEGLNARVTGSETLLGHLMNEISAQRGETAELRKRLEATQAAVTAGVAWMVEVTAHPSRPFPPIPELLKTQVNEMRRSKGVADEIPGS